MNIASIVKDYTADVVYSEQDVRELIAKLQALVPVPLVTQLRAVGVRVTTDFAGLMQEMHIETLEAFKALTTHDIWERPNSDGFGGQWMMQLLHAQRGLIDPEHYTPNAIHAMMNAFAE